jgi:hypothetical protein
MWLFANAISREVSIGRLPEEPGAESPLPGTPTGRNLVALIAEAQSDPDLAIAWSERIVKTARNQHRSKVERAIARGEIPRDSDIDVLMDTLNGPAYHRLLQGRLSLKDFVQQVVTIVVAGAKAGGAVPMNVQKHRVSTENLAHHLRAEVKRSGERTYLARHCVTELSRSSSSHAGRTRQPPSRKALKVTDLENSGWGEQLPARSRAPLIDRAWRTDDDRLCNAIEDFSYYEIAGTKPFDEETDSSPRRSSDRRLRGDVPP